jgi:hypothetical protein
MTEAQLHLAVVRSEALQAFYAAERRAGADPEIAHSRMSEYAKRLDALYEERLEVVKTEMESAS